MARTTPAVRDDTLFWRDRDEECSITVGTPAWYAWLDKATAFSFAGAQGNFTACHERCKHGGRYWRAYRHRAGKVHRAYLGKTQTITLQRLKEVAAALAENGRDEGLNLSSIVCGDQSRPSSDRMSHPAVWMDQKRSDRLPVGESHSRLLTAKVSLPPVRSDLVMRPRLIERLSQGLRHKLILISAPAGFGKTTLLSQWSQHSGSPVAWFSLDAHVNDPVRFWTHFVAALQTQFADLEERGPGLLDSAQEFSGEAFLTALVNAMAALPKDLIFVLDDYHAIESQAVHSGVAFLLDHLPPQVHLVIASRVDPPLPLARLRGKGHLTELRAADLSFTVEESASFLNEVMRLNLADVDVAALGERTEGWIVGLQLAALSLQGAADASGFIKTFAGDHRYILDYLLEDVLRRLPPDVQHFLLQTSILERLCGALCEAVAEIGDGQGMLEELERANLFTVALDNERRWYRYHHLFAECLRAHLQRLRPDDVRDLHRKASAWHAENGFIAEAVGHSLAAGDFAQTALLIEQVAQAMLKRGETTTFFQWLRALPDEVVRARPRLGLDYAWALMATGQQGGAEARLKDVEGYLEAKHDGPEQSRSDSAMRTSNGQHLLADVFTIRAALAAMRGDIPLTIALSHEALENVPQDDQVRRSRILRNLSTAYWYRGDVNRAGELLAEAGTISRTSGYVHNEIGALCQLAGMQTVQGQLRQAARTYRQALELATEQDARKCTAAGTPCVGLGWLQYEWNDLDGAMQYAREGVDLGRQAEMAETMLLGFGVLARVKQAQGDPDGALDLLEQAEKLARANNLTQINCYSRLAAYRSRLWLAQGNVEAAIQWAKASGLDPVDESSYTHESERLTLARIRIAQGKPDEALDLLSQLLQSAESAKRIGSVIKTLALYALAADALGRPDEALAALGRSLSLAESEGYIRTFVDGGAPMSRILTRFLELLDKDRPGQLTPISKGYLKELLNAFKAGGVIEAAEMPHAAEHQLAEGLGKREMEVLHLICEGYSNREIAGNLVVSLHTVKKHASNIFGKLAVTSRTQAIARSRELGLL